MTFPVPDQATIEALACAVEGRELQRQILDTVEIADELPLLGAVELTQLATTCDPVLHARARRAFLRFPHLRQLYERLLESMDKAVDPLPAAASSGPVTTRPLDNDNFILELRRSERRPERTFLVIEVGDKAPPRLIEFFPPHNEPDLYNLADLAPLELSKPVEGVIQVLLATDSPTVIALSDLRVRLRSIL